MVAEPLLSVAGVVATAVAIMVDGRNAVFIAIVAAAAGLAPTVTVTSGGPALLVLAAAAAAGLALGQGGRWVARSLPRSTGLDPTVPAYASMRSLFGPRSTRAFAAALAVPIASWVSFNVPIGEVTAVQGLLFPIAYMWTCGLLRTVVARTLEDLAVGITMIALAGASAWLLRGGADAIAGAAGAATLAVLPAAVAGWLSGRRTPRPAPPPAAAS